MSCSDQNPSEEKEHESYVVAQPVPKSVRIASWLIILLGLLMFAYGIFITILSFRAGEPGGCCVLPFTILVSWYIYNCGKRMQSGYYSFIYGYSAIGLAVFIASMLICIKDALIIPGAIWLGVILIFFIFPIVVAFLNRKRLR